MVSKLHYFHTFKSFAKWVKELGYSLKTAKEAWKGAGWYYHRGKGYFVKYSAQRDRARGGKVGKGPWRHTHDLVKLVRKLRTHAKKVAKALTKKKAEKLRRKGVRRREATKIAARHTLLVATRRARALTRSSTVKQIARYLWAEIPKKYKEGKNRIWTYISVLALAKVIHKHTSGRDIDWKSIDWSQEIDWAQGYYHAKRYVKEILGVGRYEDISEREIKLIEKHWEALAKELHLPETIDPWELKALFE